jgi:hypothetical protein
MNRGAGEGGRGLGAGFPGSGKQGNRVTHLVGVWSS